MRSVLVGCVIAVGCGGGGAGGMPPAADGAVSGSDGTSSNATPITFTLKNVPTDAGAFSFVAAYQDGSGAWQPALARSGDTYTFDVSSGIWGFAYTCQASVRVSGVLTTVRDVVEYRFAVAERTSQTVDILERCTDRIAYVELQGTLTGRDTGKGTYRVAFNGNAVFIDRNTGSFDMLVAPGTHDLLVLHGTDLNVTGDFLIDAAVVQRNVAITAATLGRSVAVNNAVSTRQLTISVPRTPNSSETTTNLFTGNGTEVSLAHLTQMPTQAAFPSTALTNTQVAAGDVYDQRVTVEMVANQAVTVTTATTTPATPLSITPPAALGTTTIASAATMPYAMYHSTWPAYAGAIGYTWTLAQSRAAAACGGAAACTNTWTAWISPGAVGAMPSYTMPDLSHLTGWSTDFPFVAGTKATGDLTAMTSSAGAMDFPPSPPAAGTKRVFAHSTFSVTP